MQVTIAFGLCLYCVDLTSDWTVAMELIYTCNYKLASSVLVLVLCPNLYRFLRSRGLSEFFRTQYETFLNAWNGLRENLFIDNGNDFKEMKFEETILESYPQWVVTMYSLLSTGWSQEFPMIKILSLAVSYLSLILGLGQYITTARVFDPFREKYPDSIFLTGDYTDKFSYRFEGTFMDVVFGMLLTLIDTTLRLAVFCISFLVLKFYAIIIVIVFMLINLFMNKCIYKFPNLILQYTVYSFCTSVNTGCVSDRHYRITSKVWNNVFFAAVALGLYHHRRKLATTSTFSLF